MVNRWFGLLAKDILKSYAKQLNILKSQTSNPYHRWSTCWICGCAWKWGTKIQLVIIIFAMIFPYFSHEHCHLKGIPDRHPSPAAASGLTLERSQAVVATCALEQEDLAEMLGKLKREVPGAELKYDKCCQLVLVGGFNHFISSCIDIYCP